MPSDEEIHSKGCRGAGEFFSQLVKEGGLKTFNSTHSVDFKEEQEEGRPIEDVLDKLLDTIVFRLDLDRNAVVDGKDFMLATGHD